MSPSMSRLLLLLVVDVTLVAGKSCAPDCTNSTPGDLVSDPQNCSNYYMCLADGGADDVPLPCPDGQKFDSVTKECIDENSLNLTCLLCQPNCKFVCSPNNEVDFIANGKNCTKYYLCGLEPGPIAYSCVPGMYFDGVKCQEDPSLCCEDCAPFCYGAFTEVPDPTNCTNFYLCKDSMYYPGPDDLLHCLPGENFDSNTGHCSGEALCFQPC